MVTANWRGCEGTFVKFATNELVPVYMRDVSALLAAEVRSDD